MCVSYGRQCPPHPPLTASPTVPALVHFLLLRLDTSELAMGIKIYSAPGSEGLRSRAIPGFNPLAGGDSAESGGSTGHHCTRQSKLASEATSWTICNPLMWINPFLLSWPNHLREVSPLKYHSHRDVGIRLPTHEMWGTHSNCSCSQLRE